jgi:hypothetical protein
MFFISTKTLVTEIPARAMLDLEEIGGEGLRDEYAVLVSLEPTTGGLMLLVEHAGNLVSFIVSPDTTIPVITYGPSSMLETAHP